MIPASTFSGKSVAVFGLGGSGRSAVRSLLAGGAEVSAWDDGVAIRKAVELEGLPVVDLSDADFSRFDALVLSPGVPLTHPEPHWTVRKAQQAGIAIIGDVEILCRELKRSGMRSPLVAITGTNGKSTTTALCGHLLREAGRDVQVGGNIGTAVLDLEPPIDARHYVLELSSYQLDLAPSLHADIAILLNLTPDHLDRHGTMEHYAAVKARIFENQGSGDTAVIGIDDEHCRAIASSLAGRPPSLRRVTIGHGIEDGISVVNGLLTERDNGQVRSTMSLNGLKGLRGSHNWQNAAVAFAAMRALGLDQDQIERGFKNFAGLAHRMQEVGALGAVRFINDSKGTNADATARALASFDTIYWIAGGRPKTGGIESLESYFPRIRQAYLIGEAAEAFAATLAGKVPAKICGTLDKAVKAAASDAQTEEQADPVVLFSPACASFDQFRNFELRGEAFCSLVRALDGVVMAKGVAE